MGAAFFVPGAIASLGVEQIAGALLLAGVPPGGNRYEFNPPLDRSAERGTTLAVLIGAGGREALETHLAR